MDFMKKGIVIGTSEYTKDFLKDCLDSLQETPYDVLVVSNGGYKPNFDAYEHYRPEGKEYKLIVNDWNGWEPAVIMEAKKHFDEFVHLMDTTVVKDINLFDKLFALEGNVVLTKGNFHYMGKFVSSLLPTLPKIFNKDVAIMVETRWLPQPYTEFTPDLPVHTNVFETVHGQNRMLLENDYMKKWKGTFIRSKEHP